MGFRSRVLQCQALILVCKHHDGFCLWPSAFTDYSVKASPWRGGKGDLVREVSDACHMAGLGFGIYLSPSDLHEPSFGRDHQKYNDYFCNQLRELLTQYGPISQVFFDGANPPGFKQHYDFPRYYRLIRELQPNAVISVHGPDVRWVGNESGRARATEWSVIPLPRQPEDHDWADMMASDCVISFSEEPRKTTTRGGRPVEFGGALAAGKRCIVIGWRENVFHCLQSVEFFDDWDSCVASLLAESEAASAAIGG